MGLFVKAFGIALGLAAIALTKAINLMTCRQTIKPLKVEILLTPYREG